MTKLIDKRLVDEAVDAYVDWREESAEVWRTYECWAQAPADDAPFAFSAYRAALDREECAAHFYAGLLTQVAPDPPAVRPSPAGDNRVRR